MKDKQDHSWRKTEEFIRVQDLDKLMQKRGKEARMLHQGRLRAIAPDTSNSPFSKGILEYEFFKKFMISTFDCYSGKSDSIQHLC